MPIERFRLDNTQGYSKHDLTLLNAAWDQITSHGAPADPTDDLAAQSMLDQWAEQLLAHYDAGCRGERLVAWFYES